MKTIKYLALLISLNYSTISFAKIWSLRIDTALTHKYRKYALIADLSITNWASYQVKDSTKIVFKDSIIIVQSYFITGNSPGPSTRLMDTQFIDVVFYKNIKILYEAKIYLTGSNGKYKYESDSLYLTSDFLSVQKPNKNADISFRIYPNPASNYAQVTTGSQYASSAYKYVIFSANGRCMLEGKLPVSGRLDLTNLLDGIYFIRLYKGHEYSESIKLVIAK